MLQDHHRHQLATCATSSAWVPSSLSSIKKCSLIWQKEHRDYGLAPYSGKVKKSICHDFKFTRNDHSNVQLLHADAYFYVGGNGFGPPKFLEPLVGQLFSINNSFFLVC